MDIRDRKSFIAFACITSLFSFSQVAIASDSCNVSLLTSAHKQKINQVIDTGIAEIHKKGKEQALKDFSNINGPFISKSEYIFAIDYNANTISIHPNYSNPKNVPSTDKEINIALVQKAKQGGGCYAYRWPNPDNHDLLTCKVSCVKPVKQGEYLIGTGIYFPQTK